MTQFFQFETDFVASLRCIPMIVRFKLDTCGVKLKLETWNHLATCDRQTLVTLPCDTADEVHAYRTYLHNLITQTGAEPTHLPIDPHPAWLNVAIIPELVDSKAKTVGCPVHLADWQKLTPLQRFALIKLSRSSHENQNFLPALQEFGLAQPTIAQQPN